jgi:hypothetical protein
MPHAIQRALTAAIYNGVRFIAFSQGANASTKGVPAQMERGHGTLTHIRLTSGWNFLP